MPPKSADEWLLRGHFSVFWLFLWRGKGRKGAHKIISKKGLTVQLLNGVE